jgi:DNA-directed RNA polymerase subunit M/transcription elongation factor TFIIS
MDDPIKSVELLTKLNQDLNYETIIMKDDTPFVEQIVHCTVPLRAYHYEHPYNRLRRAKLLLFGNILSEHTQFNSFTRSDRLSIIDAVEKSCKNHTVSKSQETNIVPTWTNDLFCELYHSICYRVSSNLEKKGLVSNPTFCANLLDKKINIDIVAELTSVSMYPEKYVKIKKRIQLSKEVEQTTKTTSMYTCGRCKEKRCTMKNLYNRSLDEGVNLKLTCINCGHEFTA